MRKNVLLIATLILILVSILAACSGKTITETVTGTQTQTQTQTTTVTPPAITITTTVTTSEELVPKSITFSHVLTQETAETTLQITIMPRDENDQLLSIEGKLSAELWTTDSSEVLLQQWDNVSITKDSFIEDSGNHVSLEYKDFKPEPGSWYYIMITLTVGTTRLTTERELQLIPPSN